MEAVAVRQTDAAIAAKRKLIAVAEVSKAATEAIIAMLEREIAQLETERP